MVRNDVMYPVNFPECEVIRWYVGMGSQIEAGSKLFQIKTKKSILDVAIRIGGKLDAHFAPNGKHLSGGEVIMTLNSQTYFNSNDVLLYTIGESPTDEIYNPENVDLRPSQMEKLVIYMNAGLDQNFARAIVTGGDANEILDLWEADWRKQYPSNDPLIAAILTGKLTNKQGNWLNSIRSDYENVVQLCAKGDLSFEYILALFNGGFGKHPEAVNDVLKGAEPTIIARIRGIKVTGTLPAALERSLLRPEEYVIP